MGLLSDIGNAIGKTVSDVANAITPTVAKIENVGAVLNAAFNPFTKDTVKANVSNPALKTTLEAVANHPYVASGVVAGGITLATNPTIAVSVAKSIIPATTKGKIIAAIAAPVVVGAVVSQPAKTIKIVAETPSALANVGSNVANLIAEPSVQNVKNLISENPVLVGGAAAAGVLATGAAVIPAIASAVSASRNITATNNETAAINAQTAVLKETSGGTTNGLTPTASDGMYTVTDLSNQKPISQALPASPATQTLTPKSTSLTKRKKMRSKVPQMQNISQRTNIIIENQNRKYLNTMLLKR